VPTVKPVMVVSILPTDKIDSGVVVVQSISPTFLYLKEASTGE
jgi:hypothetical protein